MRIAAIDIGTNTVLLLVAAVDDSGAITTLATEQRLPRLGEGVDAHRRLSSRAMERTIAAVIESLASAASFSPYTTIVAGTSAVRDAENREAFARLLFDRSGCSLEVLSGEEEARLSFRGTLSDFPRATRATLLDIGGGSTEITVGRMEEIEAMMSADVGAVRLTERFLRHHPPTAGEIEEARAAIDAAIAPAGGFPFDGSELVGIAGTVVSLAHLAIEKKEFDITAVRHATLSFETVDRLCSTLAGLQAAQIRALSAVMEGRADVITAGALVLRGVMGRFGFSTCRVSERGLRYGLVLRAWERRRR